MTTPPQTLDVLLKPCNSGMCPALYRDQNGKVFVQGRILKSQVDIIFSTDEAVVEISPEIIDFLRSYEA